MATGTLLTPAVQHQRERFLPFPSKQATMVIPLNSDANPEYNLRLGEVVSKVITPDDVFTFGPAPP